MHRVDANQAEIVDALRRVGCTVEDMARVGRGFPDLCVGRQGMTYLIEVKTDAGKLNKRQAEWHEIWRGHVAVVRTVDEALRVVGVL